LSEPTDASDPFELARALRASLKEHFGPLTSLRGTPAGLGRGVVVTRTGRFYLGGSTRGRGAGPKDHPASLMIDDTERPIQRIVIELRRRTAAAFEEAKRRQRRQRGLDRHQTVITLFVTSKLPEHRRARWIAEESRRWPDGRLSRREIDRILEAAGYAREHKTKDGAPKRREAVIHLWHESTLPERERARWIEGQLQLRPGGALSRRRIDQILREADQKTRK